MNSKTTLLLVSILSFALLANVNVGSVFATGGLDDEEEEEAIEELQNSVEEINNSLDAISLNLTSGPNEIQANCPSTEEIIEEVVENITQEEQPEQPSCPIVEEEEEPQQNQTVLPPLVIAEPTQNETQECNPIPEPTPEQNETSDLVPIICPLNGELLGYTNTTSGEQLPISAGGQQNNGTIPFLPPIEIPEEVAPEIVEQQCNVTQQPAEEPPQTIVPEEEPIEFETNCGCFVVDKSPEEVSANGGGGESVEQGLSN